MEVAREGHKKAGVKRGDQAKGRKSTVLMKRGNKGSVKESGHSFLGLRRFMKKWKCILRRRF